MNANLKRPITQQRPTHRTRDQSAARSSKNQNPQGDRRRMNNEINPHEVISTQDTQLRRKKQQNNKSKEARTLNLTGNVDLGLTRKSLRKKNLKFSTTKTTTTTEHPNEIPNYYQQPSPPPASSNHHRHNHNTEYNGNEYYRRATSTQFPIAYQLPSSLPVTKAPKQSHISTSTLTSTSTLATSVKQREKVSLLSGKNFSKFLIIHSFIRSQKERLEKIREKLSKLSEAERMEFMRLKAELKAQRSKSINETIP